MRLEAIFTAQERLALGFIGGILLLGMAVLLVPSRSAGGQAFTPRLQVRVNQAEPADLVALPGIGPVLAERILRDRQLHGRYLTLNDLSRVKGLTPKTLQRLKGLLRFD